MGTTLNRQLIATRELVKLTQSTFASGNQFMQFLAQLCPEVSNNLELSIYLLNQTIELVRMLPEKFFKDNQAQSQFITAAQNKLDELILKEEELAGEMPLQEGK